MSTRSNSGFTLIELVVTVAIVAILAAIALPSFANQMRKSRRAEAISAMQDAQLKLERYRVDHASYAGSGTTIPTPTTYAFEITADAATPNNYVIKATPQGDQAKDKCGTMTITKTGPNLTKEPVDCW
jgi:type IV pilus assembly protein PilE